ncbi:hypothetical protein [Microseira wollei]|uniref:Transposase n=1 Tax=Microseira wollei NIES-4236 TaxID=2530354 RepID=A0AAV3XRU0_9CYAN|nr:hypothetical protein [Microseira wollei]GET43105.1 hypothetical protein MiSe_79260 [Microseira wollei NIES-4236]
MNKPRNFVGARRQRFFGLMLRIDRAVPLQDVGSANRSILSGHGVRDFLV